MTTNIVLAFIDHPVAVIAVAALGSAWLLCLAWNVGRDDWDRDDPTLYGAEVDQPMHDDQDEAFDAGAYYDEPRVGSAQEDGWNNGWAR